MSQLLPGFSDPVFASQSVFRATMDAMARPGVPLQVQPAIHAPAPLCPAAVAVALALLDYETPVWLDARLASAAPLVEWLKFHTGAPVTADPALAAFAFIADPAAAPSLERFAQGTLEYPDRSATVVFQIESFSGPDAFMLSGPGIQQTREFAASPLPMDFRAQLIANRAQFPRGVDLLFAAGDMLAALPRSVRVSERNN
jgi:alpha-D-ribose 1-methylphosphonate 5-triphosphate synthase subunit PhnH